MFWSSFYLKWGISHEDGRYPWLQICESESCSVVSSCLWPHGLSLEFPRPEYGVGSLSLLQGIFPTQGSNPGLPHCREILYQLSHKGSLIYPRGVDYRALNQFLSWCWSSGAWAHPTCLSAFGPGGTWCPPCQICMHACSVPSSMSDSL